MHESVMEWVGEKVREYELTDKQVLEVGSRNVNGTVRSFFTGPYVGIDMIPGPDVDEVMRADAIDYPDDSIDVVVTTEMLEHDPYFWKSIREMARVLSPGGHLLLTTRGIGFPFHEYPHDYWRFTIDAIKHLFIDAGLTSVEVIPDPMMPGVFGLARKD